MGNATRILGLRKEYVTGENGGVTVEYGVPRKLNQG